MQQKEHLLLYTYSLALTVIALRITLSIKPNLNLNIGPYTIHHLYLGAFLLIVATIFLLFRIIEKPIVLLAGVSTGLILDELIYLVTTDGSNAAYSSLISLGGALALTMLFLAISVVIYSARNTKKI